MTVAPYVHCHPSSHILHAPPFAEQACWQIDNGKVSIVQIRDAGKQNDRRAAGRADLRRRDALNAANKQRTYAGRGREDTRPWPFYLRGAIGKETKERKKKPTQQHPSVINPVCFPSFVYDELGIDGLMGVQREHVGVRLRSHPKGKGKARTIGAAGKCQST